jgi:hypothetical protein
MISEEQAQAIACEQLQSAGFEGQYDFHSCEFFEKSVGRYPSPARWIVRFMKPPSTDGSVTDDGDELFVVRVEAESGAVQTSCGL